MNNFNLSLLMIMLLLSMGEDTFADCIIYVRPMSQNELTRVIRPGPLAIPNYRKWAVMKVIDGNAEFLGFEIASESEANSIAAKAVNDSCSFDQGPVCQVAVVAPNQSKNQAESFSQYRS